MTANGANIRVRGLVQGVGFRPTVWVIANELNLMGQVLNDGQGVMIEIFGDTKEIENFIKTLQNLCPPLARIDSIEQTPITKTLAKDFTIVPSKATAAHTGIVPDAATCHACVNDITNKNNRRYQYPFTNCTHCGPRLTIIKAIPYDRKNTSMAPFILCKACQEEYNHPADRRFHAQPNACAKCGPKIELVPIYKDGTNIICHAAKLLKEGKILAIKGTGGFHLACDATNKTAVELLRQRKNRAAKPFALMAKSVASIEEYCHLDAEETKLLKSSIAPIVLLRRLRGNKLPKAIAPGQNSLGFMLPYTPLHHLIMQEMVRPLVMTSGNSSDIPQCIDNHDALDKLQGIADYWLLNNRDIVNRVDDSVVRIINKKLQVMRRARGYAPTSMQLPDGFCKKTNVLALGGELKSTFCLIKDGLAILSQHIGDLKNSNTYDDYLTTLKLYQNLYQHKPNLIAIDAHPDYLSSKYGQQLVKNQHSKIYKIQHHHAHIASCLAENKWALKQGKVIGVALDGLGYGEDGNIWGGEFLLADYYSAKRLGCLQAVTLLGGSKAMKQPWRNTYAQLSSQFDWQKISHEFAQLTIIKFLKTMPLATLDAMQTKKINSPLASSSGRLFDAVAAAIGICTDEIHYEGQAAIELEALITTELLKQENENAYKFTIKKNTNKPLKIQTKSFWHELLCDLENKLDSAIISTRFHLGLANAIVQMINTIVKTNNLTKINTVVLSGGVFQNRVLLENTHKQLIKLGYKVLNHSQIPANDGGISLGQAVIALAQQERGKTCV